MGLAYQFDLITPSGSGDVTMVPNGVGPVASMQRLLFESFDSETCAPLVRSAKETNWLELAVSKLSRFSGVAMLATAYIGTGYLASGLLY